MHKNFNIKEIKTNFFYKVVKYKSPIKGKKVCILAGIHGDEIPSIIAVEEILKEKSLYLLRGEIYFIIVNKKAIINNTRFIEKDLNRCFIDKDNTNSHEEQIAKELKKILDKCDISLDLHSTRKKSIPFIICEPNAYATIKNFPIDIVCSGFDSHQPGATDTYMNQNGKIGICVESGYMRDKSSIPLAKDIIFIFLNELNMIEYKINHYTKKDYYTVTYMYKNKDDFKLIKKFENFERLKKGDPIGFDGKKKIVADDNNFIIFAQDRNKKNKDNEAFLLGYNIS